MGAQLLLVRLACEDGDAAAAQAYYDLAISRHDALPVGTHESVRQSKAMADSLCGTRKPVMRRLNAEDRAQLIHSGDRLCCGYVRVRCHQRALRCEALP